MVNGSDSESKGRQTYENDGSAAVGEHVQAEGSDAKTPSKRGGVRSPGAGGDDDLYESNFADSPGGNTTGTPGHASASPEARLHV